jgi:hypothetical protein
MSFVKVKAIFTTSSKYQIIINIYLFSKKESPLNSMTIIIFIASSKLNWMEFII